MTDEKMEAVLVTIHRKWTAGVFDRDNPYWGRDALVEAYEAGKAAARAECAEILVRAVEGI